MTRQVFVELDELFMGEHEEWEWREKARWIKFEEDVEEGAERWGKPHVASLSFHSLIELRKGLETGESLAVITQLDRSWGWGGGGLENSRSLTVIS